MLFIFGFNFTIDWIAMCQNHCIKLLNFCTFNKKRFKMLRYWWKCLWFGCWAILIIIVDNSYNNSFSIECKSSARGITFQKAATNSLSASRFVLARIPAAALLIIPIYHRNNLPFDVEILRLALHVRNFIRRGQFRILHFAFIYRAKSVANTASNAKYR